jgi:hypothetical protein
VAGTGTDPGYQPRGALVLTKLDMQTTAKEDFTDYETKAHILTCAIVSVSWTLLLYGNTQQAIDTKTATKRHAEIDEIRKRLVSIADTVTL